MNRQPSEDSEASAERRMLEAIFEGDSQAWRDRMTEIPGERAFQILGVATSAAVFRKWPEDPSLQTVVDYVAEIDRRARAELPVSRAVIESIIRSILGEPEFLDDVPRTDIIPAEILIITSISYDVLTSPAERNKYLDEVLAAID